jgi:hypothetical protein
MTANLYAPLHHLVRRSDRHTHDFDRRSHCVEQCHGTLLGRSLQREVVAHRYVTNVNATNGSIPLKGDKWFPNRPESPGSAIQHRRR